MNDSRQVMFSHLLSLLNDAKEGVRKAYTYMDSGYFDTAGQIKTELQDMREALAQMHMAVAKKYVSEEETT